MPQPDTSLLRAALIGYEAQLAQLRSEADAIRKQLGTRGGRDMPGPFGDAPPRARRKMSAAARKRIALAQKKRWAAFRKKQRK